MINKEVVGIIKHSTYEDLTILRENYLELQEKDKSYSILRRYTEAELKKINKPALGNKFHNLLKAEQKVGYTEY
jgi:hypothetical protein